MSKTLNITSDLIWLGALDYKLRVFDIIMETKFGTSYNAYLLKTTEGIVLFETVKDKFFDDYLEKLTSLVDPALVRYIVINHTEPDHVGSVAKLLEYAPHATVVGSNPAIKYLSQIINAPFKSQVVKEGDKLSVGNKTIRFISTPSLHWPDTMYSYIEEDQILVTCDSFGAHYANECVFKSALAPEKQEEYVEAYKYYFDMIMGPFKSFVKSALGKIKDLPIRYICPGHGLVLDETNIQKYIDLYDKWSTVTPREVPSIVIAYVSAYGYTKEIAYTIKESIEKSGPPVDVLIFDLETSDLQEVLTAINEASGLLIGSPTIVADTLPPVWQLITSLNPVIHKGLMASCFGSYGWSGEATKNIHERFLQLRFKVPVEPLRIQFKPSNENLEQAESFGESFAKGVLIK